MNLKEFFKPTKTIGIVIFLFVAVVLVATVGRQGACSLTSEKLNSIEEKGSSCSLDEDCVFVDNTVCGAAINKKFVAEHSRARAEICKSVPIANCAMRATYDTTCVEGKCALKS